MFVPHSAKNADIFAQIPVRITTSTQKNEQNQITFGVRTKSVFLHSDLRLVVSLNGIWQERTLFVSERVLVY